MRSPPPPQKKRNERVVRNSCVSCTQLFFITVRWFWTDHVTRGDIGFFTGKRNHFAEIVTLPKEYLFDQHDQSIVVFLYPISPRWCHVKTLLKKQMVWFCRFLNSLLAFKNVRMDWSAKKRVFSATNVQLSHLLRQRNQDLETLSSEQLAQKTSLKNHKICSLYWQNVK